jgi:hypothetical protein
MKGWNDMGLNEIDENGRLTTGENVEEYIKRKSKENPELKIVYEINCKNPSQFN